MEDRCNYFCTKLHCYFLRLLHSYTFYNAIRHGAVIHYFFGKSLNLNAKIPRASG